MDIIFRLKINVSDSEIEHFKNQYQLPSTIISDKKTAEIIALQTLQLLLIKEELTCSDFTIKGSDGK